MKEIYQAILNLINHNSLGCDAVKKYLTKQKRKCEFPLNWCDIVSIAAMSVILDKGEDCFLVRFTRNDSLGDHFCIKKDELYSDFTIHQFSNYEQPIFESQVHPFSKEWDNESVRNKSEVIQMLQAWTTDVNQAIEEFTDDLKKEIES